MKVPSQVVGRTRPSAAGLSYLNPNASPAAFGAGIAQGLSTLGAALAQREEKTNRFSALTNFSEFETEVDTQLLEAQRSADPSGKGFTSQAEAMYDKAAENFLATKVAPELQEEFRFRAAQVKQGVITRSLDFQYKAGDAFFRVGVDKEYQKALKGLDPTLGGDPAQLPAYKARVFEAIDTSDLSEIEKEELKRKTAIGLEGVSYKQAVKQAVAGGAINISSTVGAVIDEAATRRGVSNEGLRTIAWLESRGDPGAQNRNSSAGGLFQFIDKTAASYGLANKFDAAQSADAAARLYKDNQAGLRKVLGREPTIGEMYLAHQQGLGGASALLRNPNALAADVVGLDAVKLNGGAPGMSAGAFAALWINKANKANPDLDNNPAFSNLPYEDRLALRADAGREANAEAAAAATQRKLMVDTQVNSLLNGIVDGTRGRADYDAGVQEGWLSDHDSRMKVLNALEKKEKEVNLLASAVTKLSSDYSVWDPTDDEDKKRLNALVGKGGLAQLSAGDREYVSNGIVPLVQRVNDIPTDVVGLLTGMVRANNQTQALFALDTLRQLREADARAFDARIPESLAKDVDFYSARKDLYPADQLMELMNGGHDQATRQARGILEKEAQDYLAQKKEGIPQISTLVGEVVGEFGGLFSSPSLSGDAAYARALHMDYATAFTDAYVKTADVKAANKMAIASLKRAWGVTGIGGKATLMKHPPERVGYKPMAGDFTWIDEQVRGELGLKETDKFELISDEQTKAEFQAWQRGEGPPASYQVLTWEDQNGFPVPRLRVGADGKPERHFFQPSEEDKRADQQQFEHNNATFNYDDFMKNIYGPAQAHSQMTGGGIPEDLEEQRKQLQEEVLRTAPPALDRKDIQTMLEGGTPEDAGRAIGSLAGPGPDHGPAFVQPGRPPNRDGVRAWKPWVEIGPLKFGGDPSAYEKYRRNKNNNTELAPVEDAIKKNITSGRLMRAAPSALRALASTVFGDTTPIDESFFTQAEMKILKTAVKKAITKKTNQLGYGDYGETDPWAQGTKGALNVLTDPATSVAFTLGMAKVTRIDDETFLIEDNYDYNATEKVVKKAKEERGVAQMLVDGLARNGLLGVGNVVGNLFVPENKGRKVAITIKIPKTEQ